MDHLRQRSTDGDYSSDAAAEGWSHGAVERAQWLGPVTEMMLDLASIGRMFTRLTERHAERMDELGLAS